MAKINDLCSSEQNLHCPNLDISVLDDSIDTVIAEAQKTAAFLDTMSSRIIKLEASLKNFNAYFPFKLVVKSEKHDNRPIDEQHKNFCSEMNKSCFSMWEGMPVEDLARLTGVNSRKFWSLAWGPVEVGSKNFRLLIICEEQESCFLQWPPEGSTEFYFPSQTLLRKALIETDLGTRKEFSVYMNKFFLELAENIKSCRESSVEALSCDKPFPADAFFSQKKDDESSFVEARPKDVADFDLDSDEAKETSLVENLKNIPSKKSDLKKNLSLKPQKNDRDNHVEDELVFKDEPPFTEDLPF